MEKIYQFKNNSSIVNHWYGRNESISSKIFIGLFLLTVGSALWLGGQFFYELHDYFRLSQEVDVLLDHWEVVEKKRGEFSLCATYQFDWRGEGFFGNYIFENLHYPNPYVAESQITSWQEKSWIVWLDPHHPETFSLQRVFPAKRGIHFFLTLAVLLYFTFLKRYVTRMGTLDQRSS